MREIKDLGSLYDELNAIKSKLSFIIEASMTHQEAVLKGALTVDESFIYGQYKINSELEIDFENALEELNKMLKKGVYDG